MSKTTHISFLSLNRYMENAKTNLAVSDLMMLKSAIEVAATRGAFKAEEMATVGQCYDRLSAWLVEMTPPEQPEESTTDQEQPQGE